MKETLRNEVKKEENGWERDQNTNNQNMHEGNCWKANKQYEVLK